MISETSKFHKIDNIKIHYKTWIESNNHNDWVLLLNGHARPLSDFNMFAKFLSQNGFNIITLDYRGSGQSIGEANQSIDELINDILNILNIEGIERFAVLGISMGGVIAQILASRFEAKIKCLVLASTTCSSSWLTPDRQVYGYDFNDTVSKLGKYFSPSFIMKNKILVEAMAKEISRKSNDINLVNALKNQGFLLKSFDISEDLKKITLPTHIIHGSMDQIIAVDSAYELSQLISKSSIKIFPNIGHLFLAECPQDFYKESYSFINKYR